MGFWEKKIFLPFGFHSNKSIAWNDSLLATSVEEPHKIIPVKYLTNWAQCMMAITDCNKFQELNWRSPKNICFNLFSNWAKSCWAKKFWIFCFDCCKSTSLACDSPKHKAHFDRTAWQVNIKGNIPKFFFNQLT